MRIECSAVGRGKLWRAWNQRFPQSLRISTANMAESSSLGLSSVPDVEIDANGLFKYVLIKVIDPSNEDTYKCIVRGFDWGNYHGKHVDRSSRVSYLPILYENRFLTVDERKTGQIARKSSRPKSCRPEPESCRPKF